MLFLESETTFALNSLANIIQEGIYVTKKMTQKEDPASSGGRCIHHDPLDGRCVGDDPVFPRHVLDDRVCGTRPGGGS